MKYEKWFKQQALDTFSSENTRSLRDVKSKNEEVVSVLNTNKKKEKNEYEIEELKKEILRLNDKIKEFRRTLIAHKEVIEKLDKDSEEYESLENIIKYKESEIKNYEKSIEEAEDKLHHLGLIIPEILYNKENPNVN